MKIYIDHIIEEEVGEFVKKLGSRLRSLGGSVELTDYSELYSSLKDAGKEEISKMVLEVLRSSDVIIPLVNSEYLSSDYPIILEELYNINKNPGKFLFPVVFRESNWASQSWMVKSRIFPKGGRSYSDLNLSDRDTVLNELVQIVRRIYFEYFEEKSDFDRSISLQALNKFVFISHDHDDADFAELLQMKLEKNGINTWIDSQRLRIGQDWREEIDEAIKQSLAVIAIMSPEARKSEYVTYEWAFAWGNNNIIFPVMLRQTNLHPRLESLQYLDFTVRYSRPWDELINAIKKLKD
ncbi:MAG: toll/interleukin-1 receptor domain-containing protein [Flavobacteriales bacterium]|nr:toll/interleukin-1 receptor domain-containing protein [Flavobacteriales bacterium]